MRKLNNKNIPTVDARYLVSIEFASGGGRRPEFVRFILKIKKKKKKSECFSLFQLSTILVS